MITTVKEEEGDGRRVGRGTPKSGSSWSLPTPRERTVTNRNTSNELVKRVVNDPYGLRDMMNS